MVDMKDNLFLVHMIVVAVVVVEEEEDHNLLLYKLILLIYSKSTHLCKDVQYYYHLANYLNQKKLHTLIQ